MYPKLRSSPLECIEGDNKRKVDAFFSFFKCLSYDSEWYKNIIFYRCVLNVDTF